MFVLLQTKHVAAGVHGKGPLHEQTWDRLEGNMRGEVPIWDLLPELLGQLIMQLSRFVDNGRVILEGQGEPNVAKTWSANSVVAV